MPPRVRDHLRILLVDDQASERLVVGRLLADSGFETVQAASGAAEAMRAIAAASETFDVVICDLSMPTEDGLVFLRRLAGLESKPAVILMSGAGSQILESARRLGVRFGVAVVGAVQKPLKASLLLRLLDEATSATPVAAAVAPLLLTAADVLSGLEAHRFELWFQPQYHIQSGQVVGVEGLLRLRHGDLDTFAPATFIGPAEQSGLIGRLTDFALECAIAQCADWQARGLRLTVSVNLSSASLHDITLPDRAIALCRARDLEPSRLVFELTESFLATDVTALLDITTRLRLAGFGLSIDDFGMGYASLAELQSLPFQELKLDRTLVQDAMGDARALTILENTVRLASQLKMSIVAEGVETEAMFQMVAGLACDLVQGYLIARPMPARDVEGWLAQHAADPIRPRPLRAAPRADTGPGVAAGRPSAAVLARSVHDAAGSLTVALLLSETLMHDATLSAEHREDVVAIHEAATEISAVIQNLREHAAAPPDDVAPPAPKIEEPPGATPPALGRTDGRLERLVETYATWVRDLRQGPVPAALVTDELDPLARLGRELEMLGAIVSRRESELQKLFALVHDVEVGVRLDDILNRIYTGFHGVIPFDRIGCAFLSDDRTRVIAYWARSELGPIRITSGFERPMAGSSLEAILSSGRPRIINDLESYLAAKPGSVSTRLIVEEGGRSSLTCPLFVDGWPLGFLFFTSRFAGSYHSTHESIFLQIADQVASILDKSRLYEHLVTHNRSLLERTRRLEVAVAHDMLTGVLNRAAVEAGLSVLLAQHSQDHRCGVIMADIDRFKAINDTFGHAVGDLALREFVRRLAAVARKSDTVARFGGEEFLILVDDITRDELLDTAERFRRSIGDSPFVLAGQEVPVSASFGVAPARAEDVGAELIARADKALYAAKDGGRNRCALG